MPSCCRPIVALYSTQIIYKRKVKYVIKIFHPINIQDPSLIGVDIAPTSVVLLMVLCIIMSTKMELPAFISVTDFRESP
jgi:hypothetical protein